MIGTALKKRLATMHLIATTRKNLHQPDTMIWDLINPIPQFPIQAGDTVVFAAAVTTIEACEKDPAKAQRVNVEAVAEMAHLCARQNARLIFLSSSAVFDGNRPFPAENDTPCPITVYGRTKAEAEAMIKDSGCPHVILRLTKILHPAHGYLARTLATLARKKKVYASSKIRLAPISLNWALDAIVRSLSFKSSQVLHISSRTDCNYYSIAKRIAKVYHYPMTLIAKKEPVLTSKRKAFMIRYAALSATYTAHRLNLSLPSWQEALK